MIGIFTNLYSSFQKKKKKDHINYFARYLYYYPLATFMDCVRIYNYGGCASVGASGQGLFLPGAWVATF
jgi:hypothetical protein